MQGFCEAREVSCRSESEIRRLPLVFLPKAYEYALKRLSEYRIDAEMLHYGWPVVLQGKTAGQIVYELLNLVLGSQLPVAAPASVF